MGTGAASLRADWLGSGRSERMLVVALKRAGFAVSRSRTALWEIPTHSN
jgi:Holliday junction resolvase